MRHRKILIAHRQPFMSSTYQRQLNWYLLLFQKKDFNLHFLFSGIYVFNKVEFLLFKTTVYLHRKKRRKPKKKERKKFIIHRIYLLCLFDSTNQEWFMAYPWAYLFTLKSNLRHCRLLSRKKKLLSRLQSSFVGRSFIPVKLQRSKKKIFRLEYILGGSSFSGKRSCAHKYARSGQSTAWMSRS